MRRFSLLVACCVLPLLLLAVKRHESDLPPLTNSGAIVVDGQADVVIANLHIASANGTCLAIRHARNVTVRNSEIGPCGGNGIEIVSSSNVSVVDSYIHPEHPASACCDTGDGIVAWSSDDLLIQDNVVAYSESNVMLLGVRRAQVNGNFLLNPQGPFPRGSQVQVWSDGDRRSAVVRIAGNYALSSTDPRYAYTENQSDAISLGFVDRAMATGNFVEGGHSPSGCALIADESANDVSIVDNMAYEVGQCGVAIAGGQRMLVAGNRVSSHGFDPDAGNVGIYVWNQYDTPCGPVTVRDNVTVLQRPDYSFGSLWLGPGCEPTTASGNVVDAAARLLFEKYKSCWRRRG